MKAKKIDARQLVELGRRHRKKFDVMGASLRPLILVAAAAITALYPTQDVIAAELDEVTTNRKTSATAATFDLDVLKQRGIDPKVAEHFKEASRFSGGKRLISLQVNGQKRGLINARFGQEGQLCFNQELLDKANLTIPDAKYIIESTLAVDAIDSEVDSGRNAAPDATVNSAADTACYDFPAMVPQTIIELRPAREEVALVVPQDALRARQENLSGFQTGGTAALFNYGVVATHNQFGSRSTQYLSANTELGFNANDWIVRSRQSYVATDKISNIQSLYTYAQRTLVDVKSTLQVGQINISNSAVTGAAITGVQIFPEAALRKQEMPQEMVKGIAQSQATVEVRQSGALVHSTIVPAGPFSLTDIQLLNRNSDLVVTVIETTGATRSFTVPAASLRNVSLSAPGYSFAVGKVRHLSDLDGKPNTPLMVTASGGKVLNDRHLLSAGVMATTDYQSLAWSLDTRPTAESSISVRNVLSSAKAERVRGGQFSMSVSAPLSDAFTASASATRQSTGYRDLYETIGRNPGLDDRLSSRAKSQYSASLGWRNRAVGGISVSYGSATTFGGNTTQRVIGSWSKTFKEATVSANIERSIGANDGHSQNNNAFYLNVSMPLGGRNVRSYMNSANGKSRMGASLSEQVNEYVHYNVATERESHNGEVDVSGSLALLPRYAQVNLGYTRNSADSAIYSGQLRGGMVLHDAGLTLSPYPVKDTFGVIKVGDVAGVKLHTDSGPVWTDFGGRAVVPQLSAYGKSRLEVATKSLPRNVDIKNGFKLLEAGRGSVHYVNFDVVKVRRVLLSATDAAGLPLPKGASVVDSQDQLLTMVVNNGKLFLSNGQLNADIKVNLPDGTQCALEFTLPDKQDMQSYFETANGVCKSIANRPDI